MRPFLSVFVLPLSLFAVEPVEISKHHVELEYLVPVAPYGRTYEAAVERILGDRWGKGTMIYNASSVGDFAVSVWEKKSEDGNHEKPANNFVTFVEVSPGKNGPEATRQIDIPIDHDFATTVQRAFANMLLKSRYPRNEYVGADGWRVEFSVWITGLGGVYAQAWSPTKGLPKELMDIGFALAEYCKAPENERLDRRRKLIQRLQEFAKKADAS